MRSSFAALAGADAEALLATAGIAPTTRAEQVSVAQFCNLAEVWQRGTGGA
jgi:16S rRNA A1518/A1519 N6-dimethyltransferase RsmA/KsgA/DIM1 with predicted DNA glycosylase/AP lyase activity